MRQALIDFLDKLGDWFFLLRERRSREKTKLAEEAEQIAAAPPVKKRAFDWSQLRKPKFWREKVNRYGLVVLAALTLLLLVSALSMSFYFSNYSGSKPSADVWYYDTATGATFRASGLQTPPIVGPSGKRDNEGEGTGVRAYLMTCGSCENEKERFVGYIERYTAEAKRVREAAEAKFHKPIDHLPPAARAELGIKPGAGSGRRIAKPEKHPEWLTAESEDGAALIDSFMNRCGEGKPAVDCF